MSPVPAISYVMCTTHGGHAKSQYTYTATLRQAQAKTQEMDASRTAFVTPKLPQGNPVLEIPSCRSRLVIRTLS